MQNWKVIADGVAIPERGTVEDFDFDNVTVIDRGWRAYYWGSRFDWLVQRYPELTSKSDFWDGFFRNGDSWDGCQQFLLMIAGQIPISPEAYEALQRATPGQPFQVRWAASHTQAHSPFGDDLEMAIEPIDDSRQGRKLSHWTTRIHDWITELGVALPAHEAYRESGADGLQQFAIGESLADQNVMELFELVDWDDLGKLLEEAWGMKQSVQRSPRHLPLPEAGTYWEYVYTHGVASEIWYVMSLDTYHVYVEAIKDGDHLSGGLVPNRTWQGYVDAGYLRQIPAPPLFSSWKQAGPFNRQPEPDPFANQESLDDLSTDLEYKQEYQPEQYAQDIGVALAAPGLNYWKADEYLKKGRNPNDRPFANNTRLLRHDANTIAMRLHNTDVLTFSPGVTTFNTGGWRSKTTRDRMNYAACGRVFTDRKVMYIVTPKTHPGGVRDWRWSWDKAVEYFDGIMVADDGTILNSTDAVDGYFRSPHYYSAWKDTSPRREPVPEPTRGSNWLWQPEFVDGRTWLLRVLTPLLGHVRVEYVMDDGKIQSRDLWTREEWNSEAQSGRLTPAPQESLLDEFTGVWREASPDNKRDWKRMDAMAARFGFEYVRPIRHGRLYQMTDAAGVVHHDIGSLHHTGIEEALDNGEKRMRACAEGRCTHAAEAEERQRRERGEEATPETAPITIRPGMEVSYEGQDAIVIEIAGGYVAIQLLPSGVEELVTVDQLEPRTSNWHESGWPWQQKDDDRINYWMQQIPQNFQIQQAPPAPFLYRPDGWHCTQCGEGPWGSQGLVEQHIQTVHPIAQPAVAKTAAFQLHDYRSSGGNVWITDRERNNIFDLTIDPQTCALTLYAGDMAYHSLPISQLRETDATTLAKIYDETGSWQEIRDIFRAAQQLLGPEWDQPQLDLYRKPQPWDDLSLAATHPDPKINGLYQARRDAAGDENWDDIERIEEQLRQLDPDGSWRHEGFNYQTLRWEVDPNWKTSAAPIYGPPPGWNYDDWLDDDGSPDALHDQVNPAGLPRPLYNGIPVPWTAMMMMPFDDQGTIEPNFKSVDERRHWQTIEQRLCTLCGLPLTDPVYAYFKAAVARGADEDTIVDGPLHPRCATFTRAHCPHIRTAPLLLKQTPLANFVQFRSEEDANVHPELWTTVVTATTKTSMGEPNGADLGFQPGDRVELPHGGGMGTVIEVESPVEEEDGTFTIWVRVKKDDGQVVVAADWMLHFVQGLDGGMMPDTLPSDWKMSVSERTGAPGEIMFHATTREFAEQIVAQGLNPDSYFFTDYGLTEEFGSEWLADEDWVIIAARVEGLPLTPDDEFGEFGDDEVLAWIVPVAIPPERVITQFGDMFPA